MARRDNPQLENMLQMGITAAREGNREGARVILRQVLDADKKNDRAWLWLAYVAESKTKRQQYLESALRVNPNNEPAKKALLKMSRKKSNRERRTLMIGMVAVMAVLVVTALLILVVVAN